MIKDINKIILMAKQLRPGTVVYKEKDINSIDFSRYKFAIERMIKTGIAFIRGINIEKDIMIQDPKQYRRKTLDKNKLHYHEYYIDYSPYWKEYPKRYNSLMFLSYNMEEYYKKYSNRFILPVAEFGMYKYFVFPENNCKIAVSPCEDFIYSFIDYDIDDLYEFNKLIFNLYYSITKHSLRPKSYDEWKDKLIDMQIQFKEKINKNTITKYKSIDKSISDICNMLKITKNQFYDILLNEKLIEFIESITNPNKNKFFLVNCDENGLSKINEECEYWTDGTCLLINKNLFDDFGELLWFIKNKI